MEQYKSASARQVFFNEFGVKNSFTLENSFFKKYTEKEINMLNDFKKNQPQAQKQKEP